MSAKLFYVYIIVEEGSSEFTKVGIGNNVPTRLAELQTANPRRLAIHKALPVGDRTIARMIERLIHRRLAELRTAGGSEWFRCTALEAEVELFAVFRELALDAWRKHRR